MSAPDIIPFAKPRAISSLPTTFDKVTPIAGHTPIYDQPATSSATSTWGTAARAPQPNAFAFPAAPAPTFGRAALDYPRAQVAQPGGGQAVPYAPPPAALASAATFAAAGNPAPFARPAPRNAAASPAAHGSRAQGNLALAASPAPYATPAPHATPAGREAPPFLAAVATPATPTPLLPPLAAPVAARRTGGTQRSPRSTPAPHGTMIPPHATQTPVATTPTSASSSAPLAVSPTVAVPQASPAVGPSRWAAFEQLGLYAKKADPKQWTKHVVSMYRLLGFLILTVIVVVLIGYLVTTAFFYLSESWIVPMAISPTDEKVVSLQSQLAERQTNRDRTAAELDQAERAIAVQQEFQAEFAKAIKSDLDGRKAALERMHELANQAASTRASIRNSNSAYASASRERMAQEWKAGLIDRNTMLNGKFQLAQITSSNLSLAERQAEYETRAADLEAQTRSLEALLADTSTGETMSYDVLKIKQEYEASRLDTQKAIETRDMLKSALAREDKMLASLATSSYLRAMADGAQVAFVPYSNLHKVDKGASLYGCKLGMIICHKVGTVLDVLPGEVQFKHPHRDKQLRGQMVELRLEDGAAATDEVLFVGGRPLFI